ncbi:DUF4386 domain-containing protein [Paenibacillus sp. GSMTC-2017]|uniref:DUF4386 domain-containing protein n=1 Tax=Paenibacillus sp. GSMTC-2017 TaxID=2794350 RepID=UPI0018D8C149|nr:DUF4386 domain-containing protein [Paenibacillus sp. GSMTC-2017]MBH5316308.1 DUF4386 domain-containing protein [Paenibacillus sp. GSMTC-2017]
MASNTFLNETKLGKRIYSVKSSAAITGLLLIVGLIAGVCSVVPVIDGADYLVKAHTNETQVLTGALFQLLMVGSYVGVPIMMYPILSKHNKGLAMGSVAFGNISGVFIIIGVIILLLLLELSQSYATADPPDISYFQTLGEMLRAGRDLVNHVATTLVSVLAMLLFNCIFYRSKLVPRWLSLGGIIGSSLSIAASLLFMIRFIGIDATYMMLNLPIALQQLLLAIWLIVKGFNGMVQLPERKDTFLS